METGKAALIEVRPKGDEMDGAMVVERDRFDAVCVLFLRVLQRESHEAPRIVVSPAKGAQWVAAVFIGEPPKELLTHYQRGTADGQAMTRAPTLSEAYRVATGAGGQAAFDALEQGLLDTLRARIEGDLGAWERAMGAPFGAYHRARPLNADEHSDLVKRLTRPGTG